MEFYRTFGIFLHLLLTTMKSTKQALKQTNIVIQGTGNMEALKAPLPTTLRFGSYFCLTGLKASQSEVADIQILAVWAGWLATGVTSSAL